MHNDGEGTNTLGSKKNTIIINGRLYDSTTGRPVHDDPGVQVISPTKTSKTKTPVTPVVKRQSETPVRTPSHTTKTHKIPVKTASRTSGQQATTIHVRTERPKTLIRSAVKKPVLTSTSRAVAGLVDQPKHHVIHGHAGHSSHGEASRTQIIRSKHISKFNHHKAVVHKTADIPVQSAPASRSASQKHYDISDTPPSLDYFAPHTTKTNHKPGGAHARHTNPAPNIFEEALKSANSHKVTHNPHKKHKRLGRLGLIGLSVLILGVFFTYQNAPRIALRRAQSTIGFAASVPGYSPSGFGMSGPVQYQKGMVVINFRSNSDDRQYAVTQTTTNLDNTALASQYLQSQNKQYEATDVNGQPVYIYDNSRATWISHGVWYTIDGNAGLSRDQLTSIVASI